MNEPILIHVGIEKTGSTFLQSVICLNEELLRENGVFYMFAGRESGHHYWIAKALGFKYKLTSNDFQIRENEELSTARKEIKEYTTERLLLSSEHFDFNVGYENTKKLINLFNGRKVCVLMFLRNQIDYSQSLYLENLKWGGLRNYDQFLQVTAKQNRYNFLNRYQCWKKTGAKVIIIDYDTDREKLSEKFFEALGLGHLMVSIRYPKAAKNVTPSIDLMEFVRLLNHAIPENERRSNYEMIIKRVSKDLPELLVKRAFPIPVERNNIFCKEQENNEQLADILGIKAHKFLGGSLIDRLKNFSNLAQPCIKELIEYYFAED